MQKESSVRLRKFTADLNMNVQDLKTLGHDPDAWGALLLHVILVKLDYNTIRNWESIAAKDTLPAVKELITFLNERCQILEAIDNSKNLAYKSLPERDVGGMPINRLSRWQRVQQLVQHVWTRWTKEFLGQLQGRNKWSKSRGPSIQPGTLVLIKENNLPPLKWLLGSHRSSSSGCG